jgi:hypothetical protein
MPSADACAQSDSAGERGKAKQKTSERPLQRANEIGNERVLFASAHSYRRVGRPFSFSEATPRAAREKPKTTAHSEAPGECSKEII